MEPKTSEYFSDYSYEALSKESSDAYSNHPKSAGPIDTGRVFPGIWRDSRPSIVPWEFQGPPTATSESLASNSSSDQTKKDKYIPMPIGRNRAKSGSAASGSSDGRRTSIFWRLGNTNNEAKLKVCLINKRCIQVFDMANNCSCYIDVTNACKDASSIRDKIFKKMFPKEKEGRTFTIGLRVSDNSSPNLNEIRVTPILESKLIEICQNPDHPRRADLVISLNSTEINVYCKPITVPPIETRKKSDPSEAVNESLTPKMLRVPIVD